MLLGLSGLCRSGVLGPPVPPHTPSAQECLWRKREGVRQGGGPLPRSAAGSAAPPGEAPDRLALRGPPAGLQVWKEKRVRVGRAQSGLGDPTVSAPLTLAVPHGDSAEPPSLWPGETRCFQPGPWSSGFYLEMQVFLNRQAAHYSVSDHGTVVALWRGSGLMVTPTHSLLAWPRCRVPTGTAGHVALPGRATKVSTAADRAPFDTSLPQAGTPVDAW